MLNKPIKYFQDKNKDEILEFYIEHHTENMDNTIIDVFVEKIDDNNLELIVDTERGVVTEYEILEDGVRTPQFLFEADGTETIYN